MLTQQERGARGTLVSSAMSRIDNGKSLDGFDPEIIERAKQNIAKRNKRVAKSNNGDKHHKENIQMELSNRPRGKAVAKDGNWVNFLDTPEVSLYIHKSILSTDQSKKIAELEKIITDQRVKLEKFEQAKKLLNE